MAETIANSTENVLLLVALCNIRNRAIQVRRRVADWFEARAVEEEGDSDKHHQEFITVLKYAVHLLRRSISSSPKATRMGGECVAPETLAMENKFAGLSLEDVAKLADDEGMDEVQHQLRRRFFSNRMKLEARKSGNSLLVFSLTNYVTCILLLVSNGGSTRPNNGPRGGGNDSRSDRDAGTEG
jgi:hypothetical protein